MHGYVTVVVVSRKQHCRRSVHFSGLLGRPGNTRERERERERRYEGARRSFCRA